MPASRQGFLQLEATRLSGFAPATIPFFFAMKALNEKPCRFEFSFPNLDTVASVERRADEIVIRTSRDTLSRERKANFIRELASEGFIPEHYRWLYAATENMSGRVRWLVDPASWMPSPESEARTSRFIAKLIAWSAVLWLVMMVLQFSRGAH